MVRTQMLKPPSCRSFEILSSAMAVVGQLLLLAVAIPSALAQDVAPFSCDCRLAGNNCRQYHVECNVDEQNQYTVNEMQGQCGNYPNLACFSEVTDYVPEGYEYLTPRWMYKLYRTGRTYDKAAAKCRCDGGKLAIPTSRSEANAIASIIKQHNIVIQAFIGINDIAKEGSYVSIEGTPLNRLGYVKWKPTQPDNWMGGEDCLTINSDATYNDHFCNATDFFVCQRAIKPVPPKGYWYLSQLGFYRNYKTPRKNFVAARRKCLDDGGHLAVLETEKEAEALVKIFFGNSDDCAYVGLNDIEKGGVYVTETGKRLSELSFVNWNNRSPRDITDQNCVVLLHTGSYNVVSCDTPLPYLCEIPLLRKLAAK